MSQVEQELVAMVERSVRAAVATINDERLNALPIDLLVIFASHVCTAQLVQSHAHLIEQMQQAERHGKQ